MADSLINAGIGPFILREKIGSGGVAEVFRAQHHDHQRDYAVKVMRPERASDAAHLRAFQDEYSLLERLKHSGIPAAHRFGEIRARPAMVLDYVPGRPLHQLRVSGIGLEPLKIFMALVDIAAYLHGEGVTHNDLKLENCILRPDGRLGLVDFGNARHTMTRAFFAHILRRTAAVFGSPTYIAPEVLTGKRFPSYASDCYALGVCAFILLTGEPPFGDPTKSGRLRSTVGTNAPSIRTRVPRLDPSVAAVIDACLAKDPADRPPDATELRRVLIGTAAHRAIEKTEDWG